MATHPELSTLLATPIRDPLPKDAVKEIITKYPFIPIPHVLNLRTVSHPPYIQPNLIFRSGALSHLSPTALAPLRDTYNITTIFDLRSNAERVSSPSPEIPGIKTIWIPSGVDAAIFAKPSGESHLRTKGFNVPCAEFVDNQGKDGYVKMYRLMLETHKEPYRAVFETLRDGEGGVLFHCTAGKDRTGVLSALILSLLKAPDHVIAQDYALTRIGTEPFRDVLLAKLLQQMGEQEKGGLDTPGMEEVCSVRGPTVLAFLKSMDDEWGGDGKGVEGYLTQEIGLKEEDLVKIRERLATGKA